MRVAECSEGTDDEFTELLINWIGRTVGGYLHHLGKCFQYFAIAGCKLVCKCREDKKVIGGLCIVSREEESSDPDLVILLNDCPSNCCFPYASHSAEPIHTFSIIVLKDRKSTRLNSSHSGESRMPSSA